MVWCRANVLQKRQLFNHGHAEAIVGAWGQVVQGRLAQPAFSRLKAAHWHFQVFSGTSNKKAVVWKKKRNTSFSTSYLCSPLLYNFYITYTYLTSHLDVTHLGDARGALSPTNRPPLFTPLVVMNSGAFLDLLISRIDLTLTDGCWVSSIECLAIRICAMD